MTKRDLLLSHLHSAVFDKGPAEVYAFRLTHNTGATWSISDGTMLAEADGTTHTFDLRTLTVSTLIDHLLAYGFVVTDVNQEYRSLSARVLVDKVGGANVSDGSMVTAFSSLLWAIMTSYSGMLDDAAEQVGEAIKQMVIPDSEGEWLDLWGRLYGQGRLQNESDAHYAPRIPKEAFRLRENPIAIEEAVFDATGKRIKIEEPFNNIFRLDTSALSGEDKFQDGVRIGYYLIKPVSFTPIKWDDVLQVIDRNRAAGVIVLPPSTRNQTHTVAGINGTVLFAGRSEHLDHQKYEDKALLDYSTIETVPIINRPFVHSQTVQHASRSYLASGWLDAPWPEVPWGDFSTTADIYHTREYRVYKFDVQYESTYWQDDVWPDLKWADYNVIISSRHTRS